MGIQCTEVSVEANLEEIVKVVYDYIDLMKQHLSNLSWLLDEHTALEYIHYRFKSKENGVGYVSGLAATMQDEWKRDELLSSPRLSLFDDSSLVTAVELLKQLTIDNMVLEVMNVSETADKKEKWSGATYGVDKLPDSLVQSLAGAKASDTAGLKLPVPNKYIPSSFDIAGFITPSSVTPPSSTSKLLKASANKTTMEVPLDLDFAKVEDKRKAVQPGACKERSILEQWPDRYDVWRCPTLINASESCTLWHKQDTFFKRPNAVVSYILVTNAATETPQSTTLSRMYQGLITEALQEKTYRAGLAGVGYGLTMTDNSIFLRYSGYNEKLNEFQKLVNPAIKDTSLLKASRFERVKKETISSYKNWITDDPLGNCARSGNYATTSFGWSVVELIEALEAAQFEDLVTFVPKLFSDLSLEMFVYGNVQPQKANESFKFATESFKPKQPFGDIFERRVVKLGKWTGSFDRLAVD